MRFARRCSGRERERCRGRRGRRPSRPPPSWSRRARRLHPPHTWLRPQTRRTRPDLLPQPARTPSRRAPRRPGLASRLRCTQDCAALDGFREHTWGQEVADNEPRSLFFRKEGRMPLLWLLVILLLLFAIVGGVAVTKFLFFLLIAAVVLGLFGVFARA